MSSITGPDQMLHLTTLDELPVGYRAYVDADWWSTADALGPAIVADRSGSLVRTLEGDVVMKGSPGRDPDVAASRALACAADRAATAARGSGGSVEVMGRGATAIAVRRLLESGGTMPPAGEDRPAGIVLTSGGTDDLLKATRRVADLGRVVITAEFPDAIVFDLYPDVHLRGLALVGVPGPQREDADLAAHPLESLILERLTHVEIGQPVPHDRAWLCFHR